MGALWQRPVGWFFCCSCAGQDGREGTASHREPQGWASPAGPQLLSCQLLLPSSPPAAQELDRSLQLLCAADGTFMRQWREGAWRAQDFIADSILARRQPLQQLGAELENVMAQELEAFRAMPWPQPLAQAAAAPTCVEAAALM